MATLVYVEGFEHGVISASGGGLFSSITNAPTADATTRRTGAYSMRCYKTVAATCFVAFPTQPASQTYEVGRFYVRIAAAPSVETGLLRWDTAGGVSFYILLTAARAIKAQVIGGSAQTGPTLALDTWYCIDFRLYCGGATYTIDWQVDGSAPTQATLGSQVASTFSATATRFGSTASGTFDLYFDDVVISNATGDYPIGEGGVIGLSPNAAGTSNPGTYIQDNAGNVVDDSTNPAYVELADVPFNGATYIKQTELDTNLYAEVGFEDTAETIIQGAKAFLSYMSASASANNGQTRIRDSDGQETTVFSNDMSESASFYKSAIVLTPSGGWTTAHVNALKARVGYSSDATPDPYWQCLMIQVAYEEVAGENYSGSSSVSGGGAQVAVGAKGGKGSATIGATGALVALGFAAMLGLSSISGGGSIAATGQKGASGISSVSGGGAIEATGGIIESYSGASEVAGGGAIEATGAKTGQSPGAVSGGGALTASGEKGGQSASTVAGGGALAGAGTKATSGASEVSGGGAIVAVGTAEEIEHYSGASEIAGGGSITALGEKGGEGAGVVSAGGALAATGTKAGSGASTVAGGGAFVDLGTKSASGTSEVSGGGAIVAEGGQIVPVTGTSEISGGGMIESWGVKGRWITDCAIPKAVERTAEVTPSVRSKYAKSSKRSVTVKRRRTWN